MKTPKQLSDEVLQKISARKEKEKRIYRNTLRVGAVLLITAVIIPISLMMRDNFAIEMDNLAAGNAPATKPETDFNGGIGDEDVADGETENDCQKPGDHVTSDKDTATENAPGQPEHSDECNMEESECSEEHSASESDAE